MQPLALFAGAAHLVPIGQSCLQIADKTAGPESTILKNYMRVKKDAVSPDSQPHNGEENSHKRAKTTPSSMNRRTAAQVTRTSRACDECRKQKTRCLPPTNESAGCSRCQFLDRKCSFQKGELGRFNPPIAQSDRIELIYHGVNEIVSLLKNHGNYHLNENARPIVNAQSTMKQASAHTDEPDLDIMQSEPTYDFQHPSKSCQSSPFSLVAHLLPESGVPNSILRLVNRPQALSHSRNVPKPDVISLGILEESEAVELLDDFKQNYGRWVLFPSKITTEELIVRIRLKSPLLLTTCCCVTLRYLLTDVAEDDYELQHSIKRRNQDLLSQLAKELEAALLGYFVFPHNSSLVGDVEFLQAIAVLSLYSLSLNSLAEISVEDQKTRLTNFSLDPWYLSSVGLNTFLSKSAFGQLIQHKIIDAATSPLTVLLDELDDEEQTLTVLRIYNHLTLVHLIQCVFSGRMCVLDEVRLNYCTATLSLAKLTNFDGRVVSETEVLLIAYNYVQEATGINDRATSREREAAFVSAMDEMKQWYDQWEYLFSQPTVQFVVLCYEFSYIMIILVFNYQAVVSEDMSGFDVYSEHGLSAILRSCSKENLLSILEHGSHLLLFEKVIDNDSYFACLSDQLHFCFYFGAIVMMKTYLYLEENNQETIIDAGKRKETLRDIRSLIDRLTRVSRGIKNDILTKYRDGLREMLESLS